MFTVDGASSGSKCLNTVDMLACCLGIGAETLEIDGMLFDQKAFIHIPPHIGMVYSERMPSTSVKAVAARTCRAVGQTWLVGARQFTTGTQEAHGLALPEGITLPSVGQLASGSSGEAISDGALFLMMAVSSGLTIGTPLTMMDCTVGATGRLPGMFTVDGVSRGLSFLSMVELLACSSDTEVLTHSIDG
jgi:hypothetical protein